MLDGEVFIPSEVTVDNLSRLTRNGASLNEQRACEISELVDCAVNFSLRLFSSGMGIYEMLSLLSEGLSGLTCDDTAYDTLVLFGAYTAFLSASGRAEFSRLYVERLSLAGVPITEELLLAESTADESIAYVKNALSDEAYDVFSQELTDPRVSYCKSFKEAADAVVRGDFSYCLLPLEEAGGGRLSSVSEIIYRRDLKINAVTPVFGFDGNADVKYALLSESFTVPELLPDDDGYLEIRIKHGCEPALSELLSVADCYGISVYRVNTERFDNEGETSVFYNLVFKSTGGGFTELLVYLTLFSSVFVPVGMYKNLE